MNNSTDEHQAIMKKIMLIRLICFPGPILVGLALYGLFSLQGNTSGNFLPFLGHQSVSFMFLAAGVVIMVFELFKLIPLWKRKKELNSSENT